MTNEPKKDDPSSQWPEDVKEAYEHLKIPSLYDCLLANEKMSVEVRKQNRDVKYAVDGMQKIATVLDKLMEIISEEWDELDEAEERAEEEGGFAGETHNGVTETYDNLTDLEVQLLAEKQEYLDQTHATLLETMDSILEMVRFSEQMGQQLFNLLPNKEGIMRQPPAWYSKAQEIIQSYVAHANHVRNRLQARLEEMHIHLIEPKPGDRFDKTKHLSLEEIGGGESGTIAQIMRVGYAYDEQVLREAEVVVFI